MVAEHPDVAAGSSNLYQSWEVVDPEKWVPHGYACVRVDSRGAGRSPGFIDHFSPRETQGLLRLHRVGRRAAVVERQGRAQRHLLLRHQPVARGVAAAAASRRHVHLGRRRRLVPRHDAPRRHPLHLLGQLVRHAGEDRAVRRGRARPAQPRHRRAGLRDGDAVRSGAREEPLRLRRRHPRASARRRLSPGALAGLGRRSRCRCCRRPTGAARACIRAATSRASCARPSKDKWLEAHGIEHWTHFYTDYGARAAEAVLRPFPEGREERLGQAAAGAAPGAPRRPASSSATRTNGRSRARSGRSSISIPPAHALGDEPRDAAGDASPSTRMGDGVTFLAAPLEKETEITGPSRAQAVRLVVDQPTPTCSWCSACSRPTCKEVVFLGAIDPHTPIAQGWLRASHRKLDPKLSTALPALSHARREAAAQARRDRSSSTSRSGRPRSWCRRATASRSPCAARTTSMAAAERRQAVELQERADRLRAVPARRSARPAAGDLRRHHRRCISAAGGKPSCCCR